LIPILILDVNLDVFMRFFTDDFQIFNEAFFLQNPGNRQLYLDDDTNTASCLAMVALRIRSAYLQLGQK